MINPLGIESKLKLEHESGIIFSKNSLVKDSNNIEEFYKKNLLRFKACCLCLTNMLNSQNERVQIRIKPIWIIKLFKRIVMVEYIHLVSILYLYKQLKSLFNSFIKI